MPGETAFDAPGELTARSQPAATGQGVEMAAGLDVRSRPRVRGFLAAARGAASGAIRFRGAQLSLAARYMVVNFVVVAVATVAIGLLVGQQIESSVVDRTASLTGLYVESVIEPQLQNLSSPPRLTDAQISGLSRLLVDTPLAKKVVSFRVWSPDGEILYSPYAPLIGQRLHVDAALAESLRGGVSADISDLHDPENIYERQHWSRLLEVYVPVRARGSGTIIAVAEFYQLPDELDAEVNTARLNSWALLALAALLSYLALAGIVKQGSDTINRQQRELRKQVGELSRLLGQNARLHERVRQAARSSTALNEQALRRVSADLHDGAGQALGLALLRLDVARARLGAAPAAELEAELAVVHGAIHDGMEDMRSVAAGIRLPELETRTIEEVAERAVADHEDLTRVEVDLSFGELPSDAPHPIKIALFRTLQEALSNATRHGRGIDVRVVVRAVDGQLQLDVSDGGPGFDPSARIGKEHLGLAGMRERAELLGGTFRIESAPGAGTRILVSWPLSESEPEWPTSSV